MTSVRVDLRDPASGTDQPATGVVQCKPQRATIDDYVRLETTGFTAPLVDGAATLDLAPGPWLIIERVRFGGERHLIQVPDTTETVDYAALVDTVPAATQPATDPADDTSWEQPVAQLQTTVDGLQTAVAGLNAQVTDLATAVASLADAVTSHTGRITDLETSSSNHDTVLSELADSVDQLGDDVDQIAAIAATPNSMRSTWRWTTITTPSAGKITATDTSVLINTVDSDGTDLTNALAKLGDGSVVYAQAQSNAAIWRRWTLATAATINGNVYRFPAVLDGQQGRAPSSNTILVVGFTRPPEE